VASLSFLLQYGTFCMYGNLLAPRLAKNIQSASYNKNFIPWVKIKKIL
jgi:hypothetical protein